MLVKFHPHSEGNLIIPKGAACFDGKLVSVLGYQFGLWQGKGNFPCGKVNIWEQRNSIWQHKVIIQLRKCIVKIQESIKWNAMRDVTASLIFKFAFALKCSQKLLHLILEMFLF